MSYNKNLQQPLNLGDLTLKNRVIMAPLTRNRNIVPKEINFEYYSQRTSSGLIISEGILIEPQGTEWVEAPGIWDKEQIEAWKENNKRVHENNGLIFAQLCHFGRAAHILHNRGIPPLAPSAIKANGGKFRLLKGEPGYSIPKAIENPRNYVELYKQAAINAKEAGFDGIELHAANGHLVNQFLESHSNKRTDDYGGSIENRARFVLEIIDEFIKIYPAKRVGIKFSPAGGNNDMGEKTEQEAYDLYSYIIKELDRRDIAYIHFLRYLPDFDPTKRGLDLDVTRFFPLIKNACKFLVGGFTPEEADKFVAEDIADVIVFGRAYISNPDLPKRIFNNYELSQITDPFTLYNYKGQDKHVGYTDYPRYKKSES